MIQLKKLLREYNESETWKSLSNAQKKEILSAIDITGLQTDISNKYSTADWLHIPDYITSRIRLPKTTTTSSDRTLKVGDIVKYSGELYRIEKLGQPNSAGQIFHLGRSMSNNYTGESIPQKGNWTKIN